MKSIAARSPAWTGPFLTIVLSSLYPPGWRSGWMRDARSRIAVPTWLNSRVNCSSTSAIARSVEPALSPRGRTGGRVARRHPSRVVHGRDHNVTV
ncbi:hypothetical protein ACRAWC_24945 [Leifsonia sp. L25]|uniref:hypothetical protein n=1 Tax=Leifsonia sp. L25 TaxID=3423957 RepID=UPI003D698FD8